MAGQYKTASANRTAGTNHPRSTRDLGWKRGEQKQAVGRSRGGRNTKIHALADVKGRLIAILLTGGEAHDCPIAERLIFRVKPSKRMLGDKAYDCAELREDLHERGLRGQIVRIFLQSGFDPNKELRCDKCAIRAEQYFYTFAAWLGGRDCRTEWQGCVAANTNNTAGAAIRR